MEHMVEALAPTTAAELAEALRDAAARQRTIALAGNASKRLMAGPVEPADEAIATAALRRVLEYEPRDLTISVEAGLPWREFTSSPGRQNRQMVPLDPPFAGQATVGGVVAANSSGPRRRLYGTARDMVIGMRFATLEGKLVQSGGMVVKNVAGLDMAKLMIGSFGTLAAIAVVNFKLQPVPEVRAQLSAALRLGFRRLRAARNRLLRERAAARRRRSAESGGRGPFGQPRLASGRARRRQPRPPSIATSANWRTLGGRRGARRPPPRRRFWQRGGEISRRASSPPTPMARWCAPRVR